jgi:pantoate--beta-alanine ligase
VRTVSDLHAALAAARRSSVGFVPTMGALHAGHVALCRAARTECDHVVMSVFVNPKQFNDPADLAAYPRREAEDARVAQQAGVDTLFAPEVDEVFPPGHATGLAVQGAAAGLEGAQRPGHFDGVALVCLKLFLMVGPSHVYFGQKDAQQVAVVSQVVRDLNVPVTLRVVPTVRETDGLALSSRNARLSADERRRALAIPRALAAGLEAHRRGEDPRPPARAALDGLEVEYVEVADWTAGPTLAVAVRVGATRLIDNVPLDQPALAGLG